MRYYGITIGPIDKTLSLVAKPAGLWYASYMFSDITRMLCMYLSDNEKISILSPYYEKDEVIDGIGSYYDRVLFSFAENDMKKSEMFVQEVIQKVKTEVGRRLARDLQKDMSENFINQVVEYINVYLCIHYTSISDEEKGEKSVGEILSPYLDTLELYKSIQNPGKQNYLLTMFEGIEEDSNKYIRNSELIKNILNTGERNFQLFEKEKNRIKDLAYISSGEMVKECEGEKFLTQADGKNGNIMLWCKLMEID